MNRNARKRQGGFGLVVSLFILVVLAVAAMAMINLGGTQRHTALLSLQTVRARHASQAGLEWGLRTVSTSQACPSPTTLNPTNGLAGFEVRVTCTSTQHVEGTETSRVYEIESEASYGSFGDLDYVRRSHHIAVRLAS